MSLHRGGDIQINTQSKDEKESGTQSNSRGDHRSYQGK
jgi:hypothetical protein